MKKNYLYYKFVAFDCQDRFARAYDFKCYNDLKQFAAKYAHVLQLREVWRFYLDEPLHMIRCELIERRTEK